MEYMTAEQAAEAAKGLTFETVWAALMETRRRMEESDRSMKERMEESDRSMKERMEEYKQENRKSMEE